MSRVNELYQKQLEEQNKRIDHEGKSALITEETIRHLTKEVGEKEMIIQEMKESLEGTSILRMVASSN